MAYLTPLSPSTEAFIHPITPTLPPHRSTSFWWVQSCNGCLSNNTPSTCASHMLPPTLPVYARGHAWPYTTTRHQSHQIKWWKQGVPSIAPSSVTCHHFVLATKRSLCCVSLHHSKLLRPNTPFALEHLQYAFPNVGVVPFAALLHMSASPFSSFGGVGQRCVMLSMNMLEWRTSDFFCARAVAETSRNLPLIVAFATCVLQTPARHPGSALNHSLTPRFHSPRLCVCVCVCVCTCVPFRRGGRRRWCGHDAGQVIRWQEAKDIEWEEEGFW